MTLTDREKMNCWDKGIGRIEPFVSNHTFPIYTSTDAQTFVMHGSCVTISIDGEEFVCTANHLINSVLASTGECILGVNGRFEILDLTSIIRLHQDSVDYDLCLLKLKRRVSDVSYLPQSSFFLSENFEDGSWQYLQGFPLSKNKYHHLHDAENSILSSAYIKTVIKVDQLLTPPGDSQSTDTHLLFKYKEAVFTKNPDEVIEFRKRQNMLSLKGCSGCGIWTVSEEASASDTDIELAAIFTTHKAGTGSATKVQNLLRREIWTN